MLCGLSLSLSVTRRARGASVIRRIFSILCALLLASAAANAGVTFGNGNYYVAFSDMEVSAPRSSDVRKIERTYNSRSQFLGGFGYGWGWELEAYLVSLPDGSIKIHESGGGDTVTFQLLATTSDVDAGVQIEYLVAAKKMMTLSPRKFDEEEYRANLLNSSTFLREEVNTLLPPRELPAGTQFDVTNLDPLSQSLERTERGYVRTLKNGDRQYFEFKASAVHGGVKLGRMRILRGVFKLTKIEAAGVTTTLEYDPASGVLTRFSHSDGISFTLDHNPDGTIQMILSNDKVATYFYCPSVGYSPEHRCQAGDLVAHFDGTNTKYTYAYDNHHNLIELGYPDGTSEKAAYYPNDDQAALGGVRSVINKSGQARYYTYWRDKDSVDLHYRTEVRTVYTSGQESSNSYEYFEKQREDGSTYRYRLIAVADGEEIETLYNECCGAPLKITDAAGVTEFKYTDDGLRSEKSAPGERVRWQYSDKFHRKITKVEFLDRITNTTRSYDYAYDNESGELTEAHTSDGKAIRLTYDSYKRISRMSDQDNAVIEFRYGTTRKPIEIILAGVGAITVSYDESGEIKDVQSKGGRQIAISIASKFQNLLEIVKLAGIQVL